MQKRVGLARAIAAEPEIIFFDEPTTGLDPIMAGVINELIREIVVEMGATAMTITHDMTTVRAIADKVAMLHDGHDPVDRPGGDRWTPAATPTSTSSSTAAPRARSRRCAEQYTAPLPGPCTLMGGAHGTPGLLSELGQTPAAVLITLIIASLIRGWRHSGQARAYAASTAVIFACLLIQLYLTPFGYVTTFVLVILGLGTWTASLILTKGWYLLMEIVLMPVINIVLSLLTG